MKVAVTVWQGRVSPVFDVCRNLLLLDVEDAGIRTRSENGFPSMGPHTRIPFLVELGVDVLICGAMSRALWHQAVAEGIRVLPFVAGDIDQVIDGWLQGKLEQENFRMPGCRGRQRRRRGGGRGRFHEIRQGGISCQEETEPDPWEWDR